MKDNWIIFIIIVSLALFSPMASLSEEKTLPPKLEDRAPMPSPNVDGMDEYHKQLVYAETNITEGDYPSALYNLALAEKLTSDDPLLYEMQGICFDAMRDYKQALQRYAKAGALYLESGNIKKTRLVLAWMKSIDKSSAEVHALEDKLQTLAK
jgi:tetratricopeptide (TPR) repeat protein